MNEAIHYVDEALRSRHSIRRFLPTPVPKAMVRELLELAACAPSGTNIQPWRVYALSGKDKEALSQAILAKHEKGESDGEQAGLEYYPKEWAEPWLSRRRKCGLGLYSLLGIEKGDAARMKAQGGRNFIFFDAPVGLIFTIDRVMGAGSLLDCGMFLQNIMVAARARGLHTCPQAAWNHYGSIILPHIGASAEEKVVCGMALGWADEAARVNTFQTPREPVEGFTRWLE